MINQPIRCSHTHFMLPLNYSPNSPGSNHWLPLNNTISHNMSSYCPRLKKMIFGSSHENLPSAGTSWLLQMSMRSRDFFSFFFNKNIIRSLPHGRALIKHIRDDSSDSILNA